MSQIVYTIITGPNLALDLTNIGLFCPQVLYLPEEQTPFVVETLQKNMMKLLKDLPRLFVTNIYTYWVKKNFFFSFSCTQSNIIVTLYRLFPSSFTTLYFSMSTQTELRLWLTCTHSTFHVIHCALFLTFAPIHWKWTLPSLVIMIDCTCKHSSLHVHSST